MMITVLCVAAVLAAALLVYGYCSNYVLRAEYYEYPAPWYGQGKTVRIVMLSDLHGTVFGEKNRRLLAKIKEHCPDLICIAGDMTVKGGKGMEDCIDLCRQLLCICPVYYAMGNHEIRMDGYEDYCSRLRETGVYVLDNEYACYSVYGIKLRIYGWNADEYFYHKFWQKRELSAEELKNDLGVPEQGEYSILLAHNPEYFRTYCTWGADLVFSGHVHGGIARLPLLGGVIAPSLRLFPTYDAGEFRNGKTTMIVSRGLGTHHIRFRFFNLPEISVIDLCSL